MKRKWMRLKMLNNAILIPWRNIPFKYPMNTLLTRVKILWYDIAELGRGVVCRTLGGAQSRETAFEKMKKGTRK